MVSKHIGYSESIVFRELEKIARRTELIKDEPVIQKTASIIEEDEVVMLETSGNLVADAMMLVDQLRERGFVNQAQALEDKTVILKKAMADGGHNSLYDFWKETGEAVVNFAHKTTDADVGGYKPKNLNEVRNSIVDNISKAPTGDANKAIKMANKVGELFKKYAGELDDVIKDQSPDIVDTNALQLYTNYKGNPIVYNRLQASINSELLKRIEELCNISLIKDSNFTINIPNFNNLDMIKWVFKDILPWFIDQYKPTIDVDNISKSLDTMGYAPNFVDGILSGDVKHAKAILDSDNDDAEDWSASAKEFASYFTFKAVYKNQFNYSAWNENEEGMTFNSDIAITRKVESNDWVIQGVSQKQKDFLNKLLKLHEIIERTIKQDVMDFSVKLKSFFDDLKEILTITSKTKELLQKTKTLKDISQDLKVKAKCDSIIAASDALLTASKIPNLSTATNAILQIKGINVKTIPEAVAILNTLIAECDKKLPTNDIVNVISNDSKPNSSEPNSSEPNQSTDSNGNSSIQQSTQQ